MSKKFRTITVNKDTRYKFENFLPLAKEQIIEYMKNSNYLTQAGDKFYLTGDSKKNQVFTGYEDCFRKLLNEGLITVCYL